MLIPYVLCRVCEAAPVLRIPRQVFLWLLPLIRRVLPPCTDPNYVGLQEVPRQQFLQMVAEQSMAPAHFQFAEHQPQPVCEGQGTGQSEGEPFSGKPVQWLKGSCCCKCMSHPLEGIQTHPWGADGVYASRPHACSGSCEGPVPNFIFMHSFAFIHIF